MKVIDWLNNEIIANGLLCDEYTERVRNAVSKKQLFEIVCDANGVSFLPEMREKGFPLGYDIIGEEFSKYINGQHKPSFKSKVDGEEVEYTSAVYMTNEKELLIDTTIACVLDFHGEITVTPFHGSRIVLDQRCDAKIYGSKYNNTVVEVYGNSTVEVTGNHKNVIIKRR